MKNVISVFVDDSSYGKTALEHAKVLAQIFNTEINTVILNDKTDLHSVFSSAEEGNTLCFVMPVAPSSKESFFNVKKAKKWIRKSRIPVVTVGNKKPEDNDYQKIILPLDINCQEKELALWATYFPEHIKKNCPNIPKSNVLIHILYNQYKDALLRKKVQNNIDFVERMFNNLEVPYQVDPFSKIDNIYTFALPFAQKTGNTILLYLMPEHYSLIDLLFGPTENKILGNKEQIPVLCLNPRDDTFVLCQ